MSVPRTRAMMARPATTIRVLFNKPINAVTPLRSSDSPVEIAERPVARGPEARDDGKAETRHRNRGQSKDAGVGDHRQVEHDERARERRDQWVDIGQAQPAVQK